jgi:hypothetical protein
MKIDTVILVCIVVSIVLLGSFSISSYIVIQEQDKAIEDCQIKSANEIKELELQYKDYVLAINHITNAEELSKLAYYNLQNVNEYTSSEYYFDYAKPLYDLAKKQCSDAKKSLDTAKELLIGKDILDTEIRLRQINNSYEYADEYYTLVEYSYNEIYAVNYGEKSVAHSYFIKVNNQIDIVNSIIKKGIKIYTDFDKYWGTNFYEDIE